MTEPTHNIIVMWSGAIADIPNGWKLCDGNNNTPDLRNKFIAEAGDTYAVDDTGGATEHNHAFSDGGHSHNIPDGSGIATGILLQQATGSSNAEGTTGNADNLPPYHALCYIMKT